MICFFKVQLKRRQGIFREGFEHEKLFLIMKKKKLFKVSLHTGPLNAVGWLSFWTEAHSLALSSAEQRETKGRGCSSGPAATDSHGSSSNAEQQDFSRV